LLIPAISAYTLVWTAAISFSFSNSVVFIVFFVEFKNSVIICDEAGSLFHARFWKNTTKDFLIRLAQIRKLNIHLLLTYQYPEQIDKVFREQTQHFVLCYAATKYDRKLNLPRLLTRSRYHFDRRRFEQYESDNVFRNHPIKPKLASLLYSIDCPPLAWLLAELRKFVITLFYALDPVPLPQLRNRLLLNSDRFSLLFRCFDSSSEIAVADNKKTNLSNFNPLNKPKRRGTTAPPSIAFTVRCIDNRTS
jgi:hypothetical protein